MAHKDPHIGTRIREKREALGLSQEKLAAKLGHSHSAISKWERGDNAVDVSNIDALAAALGTTIAYLELGVETATDEEPELIEAENELEYLIEETLKAYAKRQKRPVEEFAILFQHTIRLSPVGRLFPA